MFALDNRSIDKIYVPSPSLKKAWENIRKILVLPLIICIILLGLSLPLFLPILLPIAIGVAAVVMSVVLGCIAYEIFSSTYAANSTIKTLLIAATPLVMGGIGIMVVLFLPALLALPILPLIVVGFVTIVATVGGLIYGIHKMYNAHKGDKEFNISPRKRGYTKPTNIDLLLKCQENDNLKLATTRQPSIQQPVERVPEDSIVPK